jgi:hypothetical protein
MASKAAKAAYKARRLELMTRAQAIVAKGVCPTCGTKLYRNLSLSGWWQCGHVGAVGFQREPGPHCNFDIFYDVTPEEHAAILAAKPPYEPTVPKEASVNEILGAWRRL